MRFFVGITDHDWFEHLSTALGVDEVNFWQPGGRVHFRALQPGEPFLFKLHSPNDYIVGGGFFSHSTLAPASFAWSAFGEKNGAHTEAEMRARIERYRRVPPGTEDYVIGCILLEQPFFIPREHWIALPDWRPQIVQGRGYDSLGDGRAIWERVQAFLSGSVLLAPVAEEPTSPRYGEPSAVLPRLGQGSFRVIVTDSYARRCAFTNSPVLHVLEAAHIKPYAAGGTHMPSNGILLRQDLHTLFDRGYVTVTPAHRIEVSRRIHEEFDNGKEYYRLHGSEIRVPELMQRRPSAEFLSWHNENVYRG